MIYGELDYNLSIRLEGNAEESLVGMAGSHVIYSLYAMEYDIEKVFPWSGLLAGLGILFLAFLFSEIAAEKSTRKMTLAEILKGEDKD